MDNNSFHLTDIYGPAASTEKFAFITWLLNFFLERRQELCRIFIR
jgi:hypothetical protein